MGISVKDLVAGRKTFFITPDISLIPESYLEDYFALGYECYFVENDKRIPLEKKLDIILSTFDDVILFFNVDANIPDISWPEFINKLIKKYNNKVNVGVMYVKRQAKDDRAKLGLKYLYDMELNCGCIQLEYQKKLNFDIIEKSLFGNQAQGRRHNDIRAFCTNACTFSCIYDDKPLSGCLQDISLSHFSFVMPKEDMVITPCERIKDCHISLRGMLFRSDAVLVTKRDVEDDQVLCVFAFVSSNGSGLEPRVKQMMIPNIYRLMSLNISNLITQIYTTSEEKDEEGKDKEVKEISDESDSL